MLSFPTIQTTVCTKIIDADAFLHLKVTMYFKMRTPWYMRENSMKIKKKELRYLRGQPGEQV